LGGGFGLGLGFGLAAAVVPEWAERAPDQAPDWAVFAWLEGATASVIRNATASTRTLFTLGCPS
jgi:hypothetical protein